MSADSLPDAGSNKKPKSHKSQLRVVFDTNALYVAPTSIGSASDLVRDEIVSLISDSMYPDLEIRWYLPEIVRHERQYQMQAEALKLRGPINRIERLLGHNLALTDQALLEHVKIKIDEKEAKLGLKEIKLDPARVDWNAVIHAASYRLPPFQAGEKEKGFRDALVAESFLQILADSPKSSKVCRVVIVTDDQLLSQAINERIASSSNASVLSGVEELKGLINTLVSNVTEEFIALLKPKAERMFFVSSDDKTTLYYRENVRDRIGEKFKTQLEQRPAGTMFRRNGKWMINTPNFSRKEGRRIFWTSRIEIEVEAGTVTAKQEPSIANPGPSLILGQPFRGNISAVPGGNILTGQGGWADIDAAWKTSDWNSMGQLTNLAALSTYTSPETRVVTHKGRDVYEVLWSAEVTMSKELKKSLIEDLKHIELKCEPALTT